MTSQPDPAFEAWLEGQLGHSARAMLASISPLAIVKHRPGFGQTVRPIAGAIVASPVLGAYDPDPDYFFHWFRDSAVVIDALRLLYVERRVGDEALQHLRDFTRFSLELNRLDGAAVAMPERRTRVARDFLQYLREDHELARVRGDAVAAETRVNPDGTLDVSRWARPQHDGPPLRALALLRWVAGVHLDAPLLEQVTALIRFDLDFTLRHWREPSYDIWEEESGHHYYTLRVSAAALREGSAWLLHSGDTTRARRCAEAAQAVLSLLDGYWVDEPDAKTPGYYRSRVLADGRPGAKALDIAVILSAIHGDGPDARHGVADPRMQATLARLEALFVAAYPINQAINRAINQAINQAINHGRAAARGPAMGRYAGDVYYSGGAYYFSTLGAAEFCFRAAALGGDGCHWFERGEAYLATVRAYTPASGDLSEQFDQRSGAQTSAKHLAWSYAAFISCASARRVAAAACRTPRPR
ncbi:MAG: glucan 1,4-alpha-glucosidase [Burkholderiales bacterium]|nr:glucan 1,4-alpha-glucosidase [Burkholderiales bacterium]